jgi:hypothetical protein
VISCESRGFFTTKKKANEDASNLVFMDIELIANQDRGAVIPEKGSVASATVSEEVQVSRPKVKVVNFDRAGNQASEDHRVN